MIEPSEKMNIDELLEQFPRGHRFPGWREAEYTVLLTNQDDPADNGVWIIASNISMRRPIED